MKRTHYTISMKVLLMLVISAVPLLFNSSMALGQTSGRGNDGYTRVMWIGDDSSIQIWKLDGNLNFVSGVMGGPYPGWVPIALAVGDDSYTRVVWRSTTGEMALWLLDPYLNLLPGYAYGPYVGWLPETTAVDSAGYEQIIWRHTLGYMAIWIVSPDQSEVLESVGYANKGYSPGELQNNDSTDFLSKSPIKGLLNPHSLPKEMSTLKPVTGAPSRIK